MDWMHILITIVAFIIGAIPLYIAVILLGGRASVVKVILVNLGIGFLEGLLDAKFQTAWVSKVLSFLVLLVIYKFMFDLGWIRAVLVWILQFVLTVVMLFLAYNYLF